MCEQREKMSSPSELESPKLATVGRSSSQSLFQIYYLGCTQVDRRCSSVVMPWIIEELKLKTEEMRFLWLTPGPETVSFVADSGQEMFSHSYHSILQCCIAVDGISFAYICRGTEDSKYYCHVFQALTYEEAEAILSKFKPHAREEVSIGSTISRDKTSDLPTTSSGLIFSSSLKHHPPERQTSQKKPREGSEYHVQFLGKYEVPPPSSGKSQTQVIEKIVVKLKEAYDAKVKKESLGSRLRAKFTSSAGLKSSSTPALITEETDSATPLSDDGLSSHSNPSLSSQDSESTVSMQVHSPSPDQLVLSVGGTEDGTTGHVQNGEAGEGTDSAGKANGGVPEGNNCNDSICSDFDTLPELAALQDSAVFQSLSGSQPPLGQKVKLVFAETNVMLISEESGERIMKKSVKNIHNCTQVGRGKRDPEYFAFTGVSKEGGVKKYHSHLFLSNNKKEVVKILETFKSLFLQALSYNLPAALCDTCPLRQLHTLCRNLQGVSTQVAQSIIQDCLLSFGEDEYGKIMKQYKLSGHADHEYTQIIVLVGLIRLYYQRQQELHTHPGTASLNPTNTETSSRLKLPALTRAKDALTSSFENLKNRPTNRSGRFLKKPVGRLQSDDRVSQSLSVRSASPLFSKKADIDTLMAPLPTTPVKEMSRDEVLRERSWSDYSSSPRISPDITLEQGTVKKGAEPEVGSRLVQSEEVSSTEGKPFSLKTKPSSPSKKKTSFDLSDRSVEVEFKAPSTPVRKLKSRRSAEFRLERQSKTPPAPSSGTPTRQSFKKTHRRATSSSLIPSWRQEIFESINTPDRRSNSKGSDNILEDFEIIDVDQLGGSWCMPRGSMKSILSKEGGSPRTRAKKRWKNAIEQQIILNRMEKQNSLFMKASSDNLKKMKLCYSSPVLDNKDSMQEWDSVLSSPDSFSDAELSSKLIKGVPPSKRGRVWPMLAQRYKNKTDPDWSLPPGVGGADGLGQLLDKSTDYEQTIVVDLARTFPTHPYFARPADGQTSLKNVLHSYAVADPETGYCQGLSFVTGIILMHTEDDTEAFELLHQLLTLYNYREVYFENLAYLQMRLYQLYRLLHDYKSALYQHLNENEIKPFFYAAPWFLTIFASQFPVAFTARVFDMVYYEGTDFVLKVVLALLQVYEDSILQCQGMEQTCKYLKNTIPEIALDQVDEIIETASKFEFGGRLATFEAEYEMMADLNACFESAIVVDDFPSVAEVLKKQNVALIEQLAICHASNSKLESMVTSMQSQLAAQNQRLLDLEAKLMSIQQTSSVHSSGETLNTDQTTQE